MQIMAAFPISMICQDQTPFISKELEMRDLTVSEVEEVSGGITAGEAGLTIISLGFFSPVTMGFGLAIGGALIFSEYMKLR